MNGLPLQKVIPLPQHYPGITLENKFMYLNALNNFAYFLSGYLNYLSPMGLKN